MTPTETLPSEGRKYQRILGVHSSGAAGPTILVMGGIHGNEPAGVHALRRVLAHLHEAGTPIAGKVIAIAGNLAALSEGHRYAVRDLNRKWASDEVEALQLRDPAGDQPEDREQREILDLFEKCVRESEGPVAFLDLHTSSADGPPFTCLGDTLVNRQWALSLQVPVILGLEETVDGAVLEYFNERGIAGIAVEGGRHERPETIDHLEAAVWLGLVGMGVVAEADAPDLAGKRRLLQQASAGAAKVVEIREHHKITPEDEFVMAPGYQSFQKVEKGQLLAHDRNGEIRAREPGRVLLPLYQGQGDDGFFLCRDVKPFWLRVAEWMRGMRLHAVLPWLPGIRRHPNRSHALLVNPRVARVLVREVFHLLGYRRCRPEGTRLVFTRRTMSASTRQLPWRRS